MRFIPLLCLFGQLRLGKGSIITPRPSFDQPTPTQLHPRGIGIRAVTPTAPGQIGVNPVQDDLGDVDDYRGVISTSDQYLEPAETGTKWLGVDTGYLTVVPPSSTIQLLVATATAAVDGLEVGDILITLGEGFSKALQGSAEAAISACNTLAKRQVGAALSCVLNFAEKDATGGGLIDQWVKQSFDWVKAGFKLAEDAPPSLVSYFAEIATIDLAQKTILWMALFAVIQNAILSQVLSGDSGTAVSALGRLKIPAPGFAARPKNPRCTGDEPLTIESPICATYQCQGGTSGLCSWGVLINCPCLIRIQDVSSQEFNQTFWDFQQEWLVESLASIPSPDGACVPVGNRFPSDLTLRILPIGASIVYGYLSTDNNGFRDRLRQKLVANGASVNFVGEVQHGNMVDNDVSGFPGLRIEQLAPYLEHALPWLPNVILINAGSNDAGQSYFIDSAHKRLGDMLDRIISALPSTVILISNVLPNGTPATEANAQIINANLGAVIQERIDNGALVHFVDMHSAMSLDDIRDDGTHPTDAGYLKMGDIWYTGMEQVFANCWLTPPAIVPSVDDNVPAEVADTKCEKVPGNTKGPNKVQQGSGDSDGIYVHLADVNGQANIHTTRAGLGYNLNGVYWADINGETDFHNLKDGIDDFVYVYRSNQNLGVALSDGSGVNGFGGANGYLEFAIPMACDGTIHFKDIDGDGRADYICISPNGDLSSWRNTPGSDPRSPKVRFWVNLGVLWRPSGGNFLYVLVGDIDGDGKVDYCTISTDGKISAWRNGGVGVPTYWQAMGEVFAQDWSFIPRTPGSQAPWGQFRLVDINGDGRDDVLWVSNSGEVWTWTNLRGESVNSLAPFWLYAGQTHTGGATNVQNFYQVLFGNVKGHKDILTWQEYRAVGADYTVLYDVSHPLPQGETSTEKLVVKLWFNKGTGGGSRQPGDGVRYCDMRGKGADDYIWVAKDGALQLFGNYRTPPFWEQYGQIFNPGAQFGGAFMQGYTRQDIHLADLNGDGKCDFLMVDRTTGAVRMVRNDYNPATDKFAWTNMGIVFDGGGCPHRNGKNMFDLGVRFADITGNGYPDYLCIAPDGTTTAWINTNMKFASMGQAKASVGADRVNLRFVDMNGDGRADLVWTEKYTGTYSMWSNSGPGDPADNLGSHIHWNSLGYSGGGGNLRGECNYWSDLNGDGRADLTIVHPKNSEAYTYWNLCPGSQHSAPMTILPALPGTPFAKRSIGNETQFPDTTFSLPPRRPLIKDLKVSD